MNPLICKYGYLTNRLTVNYAATDQTPNQVSSGKYIIKPTGFKYSEVRLTDMEIFKVIGNLCPIQVGDILSTDASEGITRPDITIFQNGDSYLGFKSDRIGDIKDGLTTVYHNIRFAYLTHSAYPGRPLDREFKDSMSLASIEVVTFKKSYNTTGRNAEGLYLHQTDTNPEVRWVIQTVVEFGDCQVLTLKRDG